MTALSNALMEHDFMEIKRIPISSKRQITIPKRFYDELNLTKEVECFVDKGILVIKPISEGAGDFSEYILRDLIAKGLQGEELLTEFKKEQGKIRAAVQSLLVDAHEFAAKATGNDIKRAKGLFETEED